MEVAEYADVSQWIINTEDHIRAGLVGFLEESSKTKPSKRSKKKKKRPTADVSAEDEGGARHKQIPISSR